MEEAEVRTQAELEEAIASGKRAICVRGAFSLTVRGSDAPSLVLCAGAILSVVAREASQPHIEARGSSQPHIVARGSSQPHIVALEASQPHIEARGSSQPHIEAWEASQPHIEAWEASQPHVVAWEASQPHVVARGSSQPHIEARGYAQLSLFGKVVAKATAKVSVLIRGLLPKVRGGKQTRLRIRTAAEWCEYYGVEVKRGVATLYKSVNADFSNGHNRSVFYTPGTRPKAPDWDGGEEECGDGLHFSPSPAHALGFHSPADGKFVICPVKVSEIVVHEDGEYPQTVKAPRCCGKVLECDRYGKIINKPKRRLCAAVRDEVNLSESNPQEATCPPTK